MSEETIIAIAMYVIWGVCNGLLDWVFENQFNPMNTKERIISAVKFGVLWPFYYVKAVLNEFL